MTGDPAAAPSVVPATDAAFTANFVLSAGTWTDASSSQLYYMFAYATSGHEVRPRLFGAISHADLLR